MNLRRSFVNPERHNRSNLLPASKNSVCYINKSLPLFYGSFEFANAYTHANTRLKYTDSFAHMPRSHMSPITVDEFAHAHRTFPIVFSIGDDPIPVALLGLHDGTNTFLDEEGCLLDPDTYVPAYMRRYPFLLGRTNGDPDELVLGFDPTCSLINETDGAALFENGIPSSTTKKVLSFCEQFEIAGRRTQEFASLLTKSGLLMDGEVAIERGGDEWVYRGFRMVDADKLKGLSPDAVADMNGTGLLLLLYQHLQSLDNFERLFLRHEKDGSLPKPTAKRTRH